MRVAAASIALAIVAHAAGARAAEAAPARRPGELFLALGPGSALCDDKKPISDCPVDGGFTLGVGGGWRFAPHFSVGGDLALWGYHVRDAWKGKLDNPASEVTFSGVLLAPHLRWYWFGDGPVDAYLQAGVGFSSIQATASNAQHDYKVEVTGTAWPVALGVEWIVLPSVRVGGQLLAYVQASKQKCETSDGVRTCTGTTEDENAIPWRAVAVGTWLFGG